MAEEEEQEEQGPAGLRKHAKELERELGELRAAQERDAAELLTFRRERAFSTAATEAKVEGVTLADVGDLPPDQITAALIRAKAQEKEAARRTQEEAQAKALGFESVEDYQAVLTMAKELKAKQAAERAVAGAVATSGPGQPPVPPDPSKVAFEAWEASKAKGRPADYAQADFVGAKARAFLETVEPSAPGAAGRT